MKRNNYVRPMMRSVEMQHRTQMLDGSPGGLTQGVSSKRVDYGVANDGMTTDKGFNIDGNGRWVWN